MHRTARHTALIALASAAMVALAGCAPGGGQPPTQSSGGPVVTDPAKMGDVTLTLVDFWRDAEGAWMQKSIDAFHAKYPNITVKRTVQDWGQIMDTATLRLGEDDAPDIITVNNGWQSMGTLAKGKLIVNLDPYAEAYGWNDFLPSTIKRQVTFSADGTKMGTGAIWAAPSARVQNIGIYYNKAILQQNGLDAPQSLADFEKDAAALKAAGVTPIAYGETDKPIAPLFALMDILGDRDSIADVVYGASTEIAKTGLSAAAGELKSWGDKGWLMKNYQGLSSADANAKFLDGKAAFVFYYSGLVPLDQANRADFGYLQLPQANGGKMVATGAPADNLAIGAKSKHKDAAAALLNFLMSKEAAQLTADAGYMPLLHDVTIPKDDPLIVDEASEAQRTEADNGYVPYFDWTTPTMLDTVGTQAQLLLAGRATPDAVAAAVQADVEAFQAQK